MCASLSLSNSYSLTGGSGQFSINPATGQIITSSLLDREARGSYQLLVVASDGGQPKALSSSATVSVVVADINDNPPRFHHHPYVTHIPASTSAGDWHTHTSDTGRDGSLLCHWQQLRDTHILRSQMGILYVKMPI